MSAGAQKWHEIFGKLLLERKPPDIEVLLEFPLADDPQRVAFLLLRRVNSPSAEPAEGTVLRGLWQHIRKAGVVEFKSIARPPRRGDLTKLLGYAAQYQTLAVKEVPHPRDVAMIFITACMTPTLQSELDRLDWKLESLGNGYWRIAGCMYPGVVAFLDEVAPAERDELLGFFGHGKIDTVEDVDWLQRRGFPASGLEAAMRIETKEQEEMLMRALVRIPNAIRMKGVPAKERLRGLPPEERLQDLAEEDVILALPDKILVRMPANSFAKFPAATRKKIALRRKQAKSK